MFNLLKIFSRSFSKFSILSIAILILLTSCKIGEALKKPINFIEGNGQGYEGDRDKEKVETNLHAQMDDFEKFELVDGADQELLLLILQMKLNLKASKALVHLYFWEKEGTSAKDLTPELFNPKTTFDSCNYTDAGASAETRCGLIEVLQLWNRKYDDAPIDEITLEIKTLLQAITRISGELNQSIIKKLSDTTGELQLPKFKNLIIKIAILKAQLRDIQTRGLIFDVNIINLFLKISSQIAAVTAWESLDSNVNMALLIINTMFKLDDLKKLDDDGKLANLDVESLKKGFLLKAILEKENHTMADVAIMFTLATQIIEAALSTTN